METKLKKTDKVTEFIAIKAFSDYEWSDVAVYILHITVEFLSEIRNLETTINIVNQKTNGSTFIEVQDDYQGVFVAERNILKDSQFHSFVEFENGFPDLPMDLIFQPANEELEEFILVADSVGIKFKATSMESRKKYYTEHMSYHVFYQVLNTKFNEN